ncbi:uroporphyrinogen-III synthase [Mesorhizobium sp. A623]
MRRRVLVTRPEPGAARTATRLAALGFEPVLLPLTRTHPLPVTIDGLPEDAVAIAATSANALRHAPAELIAALAHLPCHAVGKRTAEAARAAGFLSVHEGPGDAEALAAHMAASLSGMAVVYLCGRVRLSTFEQRLGAASVRVHPVETYDTVAIGYDSAEIAASLDGHPVDTVLLYSVKAAQAIRAIARTPELAPLFDDASFLCLSRRVAAALDPLGRERIHVSREPNEEALFDLLRG